MMAKPWRDRQGRGDVGAMGKFIAALSEECKKRDAEITRLREALELIERLYWQEGLEPERFRTKVHQVFTAALNGPTSPLSAPEPRKD